MVAHAKDDPSANNQVEGREEAAATAQQLLLQTIQRVNLLCLF